MVKLITSQTKDRLMLCLDVWYVKKYYDFGYHRKPYEFAIDLPDHLDLHYVTRGKEEFRGDYILNKDKTLQKILLVHSKMNEGRLFEESGLTIIIDCNKPDRGVQILIDLLKKKREEYNYNYDNSYSWDEWNL